MCLINMTNISNIDHLKITINKSSIENSQITKCKNVENTNHAWELFSDCLKEVIEDHGPSKTKKVRPDQPPFMNTRLKKEIWKKTNE